MDDASASDSELIDLGGPPRLLPFSEPDTSLEELLTTGEQVLTLTPPESPEQDHACPAAEVTLSLGMPFPALLRSWLADSSSSTTPLAPGHLDSLADADSAWRSQR